MSRKLTSKRIRPKPKAVLRLPGCKQRIQGAVNDKIEIKPPD
jgi:hypothetical protein